MKSGGRAVLTDFHVDRYFLLEAVFKILFSNTTGVFKNQATGISVASR